MATGQTDDKTCKQEAVRLVPAEREIAEAGSGRPGNRDEHAQPLVFRIGCERENEPLWAAEISSQKPRKCAAYAGNMICYVRSVI